MSLEAPIATASSMAKWSLLTRRDWPSRSQTIGVTSGRISCASMDFRMAASTFSILPLKRWLRPLITPTFVARTALVIAQRRPACVKCSKTVWETSAAASRASDIVGASVTPSPWISERATLCSPARATSWWPMPWTRTTLIDRLRRTAISVTIFVKFSWLTMEPSTAITKT